MVTQTVKNLSAMQETQVQSLEKRIATHANILAWRIPWTEERSLVDYISPWGRKKSDTLSD